MMFRGAENESFVAQHWNALRSHGRGSAEAGQPRRRWHLSIPLQVGDVHERSHRQLQFLINTMPLKELVRRSSAVQKIIIAATRICIIPGMFVGIGVAGPVRAQSAGCTFRIRLAILSRHVPFKLFAQDDAAESFLAACRSIGRKLQAGNANDVVDRTIAGMVSSKLLTPEQAESKIVSRQLLRVPYSYPVPTIGRDWALAAIHRGSPSRGTIRAADLGLGATRSGTLIIA
jgi:hypothetical protein